ncbi:fumarylacetoacetate hydrolase family protein [Zhihengliuella flava]|uniref:Acylpyruvate hydrolase n=1 Tax=Zhihengliuella flava TaxID=1285193 RepID=A0A931DBJ1_9MICC|nr:fumarylacetoacetate hydrolase family protein [Zhihengliuella flava]MBG6084511.1 acylpyruvate hydrolase [Zhihengliuella flava]
MKFATLRRPGSSATFAAVITDDGAHEVQGYDDVAGLLAADAETRRLACGAALEAKPAPAAPGDFAPVIPHPSKIFCVGLNYRNHAAETGNELPQYPTLFTKFADTLCGAGDSIEIPAEEHRIDWEGELAVVIGEGGRRIPASDAAAAIAGYAVANDVSMRGWQGRTSEWTQGKCWEASTPLGPYLVTADAFTPGGSLRTRVNGEVVQQDSTGDLIFTPEELVAYCSTLVTLRPGDLILTGTPAGVALGRKDPETGRRPWLAAGDVLETEIEGLGTQRNVFT